MIPDDLRDDLQAWIDGELPEARAREVQAAVERDPDLRRRAEELRAVDDLLSVLPTVVPSPGFAERVSAAAGRSSGWRRVLAPRLVAGAAAAALLTAGVFLWPGGGDPSGATPSAASADLEAYSVLVPTGDADSLEALATDIEWIDREFLPLDD